MFFPRMEKAMRLVFLCWLCLWLIGCASEPTPAPPEQASASPTPEAASPTPDVNKDINLAKTTVRTKKGERWALDATKIDWFEGRRKAKAYNVDWDLLDEKEQPAVNVKAPSAEFDLETETVEFFGQTVATRLERGDLLKVNHLLWDGKKKMFYGSKGVRWIKGLSTVVGDTMEATAHLEHVELEGNVRARTVFQRGNEGDEP